MTLKKWVNDPKISGNDQPFFEGDGDSRSTYSSIFHWERLDTWNWRTPHFPSPLKVGLVGTVAVLDAHNPFR